MAVALGMRLMQGADYQKLRTPCPLSENKFRKWDAALAGFCRDVKLLGAYIDAGACIRPTVLEGIAARITKLSNRVITPQQTALVRDMLDQIRRAQPCLLPPITPVPETYTPPCRQIHIPMFPEGPRGWLYRAVYALGIVPVQTLCVVPEEWAGVLPTVLQPQCHAPETSLFPYGMGQSIPIASATVHLKRPDSEQIDCSSTNAWINLAEQEISNFTSPGAFDRTWPEFQVRLHELGSHMWLKQIDAASPSHLFNIFETMRRVTVLVDQIVQQTLHSNHFPTQTMQMRCIQRVLVEYQKMSQAWVEKFLHSSPLWNFAASVADGPANTKSEHRDLSRVLEDCKGMIAKILDPGTTQARITNISNILYQINMLMIGTHYRNRLESDSASTPAPIPTPLRNTMEAIHKSEYAQTFALVGISFLPDRVVAHYHVPAQRFKARADISYDARSKQLRLEGELVGQSFRPLDEIRAVFSLLEQQPFVHVDKARPFQIFEAPFSWKIGKDKELFSLMGELVHILAFYSAPDASISKFIEHAARRWSTSTTRSRRTILRRSS